MADILGRDVVEDRHFARLRVHAEVGEMGREARRDHLLRARAIAPDRPVLTRLHP